MAGENDGVEAAEALWSNSGLIGAASCAVVHVVEASVRLDAQS